ncbi:MAG: Type 1 glutamine amidotransferase-like domain-containing protein [Clostridia bacterium]|nr:Type 1 glutamine amidotransferase-like domain-containing protein [Clostridia bacterium]MBQ7122917.1 Type 1 glutamine amidotransferase-like domain-containing protein [Clostridia bacterium]
MGIIIGVGGGKYSDNEVLPIFEHIVSLSKKKNPSVLFVPTAGFDDINGDEHIFRLFIGLGCSVSALFLTDKSLTEEEIEDKILSADIVYAGGGNLEFLMNTWKETGADKAFIKAYEKGVILSGYSSGSMCWFAEGYDDCGENHSFMFVDCLGLLPYSHCPHFEGGNWASFADAVKGRKYSGIAADDGAALVYDNGKYYTLQGNDGGEVYFFDAEKEHEKSLFECNKT